MDNYSQFKRIRNQLRKLNTLSLVFTVTKKLRAIESKSITEWNVFLPWRLLLLLKWGYEYSGTNIPLRVVDDYMLAKLNNMVYAFEGAETNPFLNKEIKHGLPKFLRTISFQQFWFQYSLGKWAISRQRVLFCSLPDNDPIRLTIEQSINELNINTFLELSMLVWTWLLRDTQNILFRPSVLFSNLDYHPTQIILFLKTLSRTQKEIQGYLGSRTQSIENPYFQLTEMTPFVKIPFLNLGEEYLVYSEKVLQETITSYFYDTMKLHGGSLITEKFSVVFERYINRSISYLGINYYTENHLFHEFPKENVTDFLLPFPEFTLMIEAKAIEMRPIVQVNPNTRSLQRELKDSIIKGAVQGFSLAKSIMGNEDDLKIENRNNFFLMIVTYKDLFLGPGDLAWEEFLRDSIEPILESKNISTSIIPPDHIIFLSINEFDQLISIIWQNTALLPEILAEMLKGNQNKETIKWTFMQHLDGFSTQSQKHPFLNDEFDELSNVVLKKFTGKS